VVDSDEGGGREGAKEANVPTRLGAYGQVFGSSGGSERKKWIRKELGRACLFWGLYPLALWGRYFKGIPSDTTKVV